MTLVHTLTLFLHSYLRWVVLGLGVTLLFQSWLGWRRSAPWSTASERLHEAFVGTLRLQFLLGLFLYVFLSPLPRAFWTGLPGSMKESVLRFFGMEHIVMMLLAIAVAEIGRGRSKRSADARGRQKRVFLWNLAALLLLLSSIPWPFLRAGRPLFRTSAGSSATEPSREAAPSAEPTSTKCPPIFQARCASCHGAEGRGDGVLASSLVPRPRSFVDPNWVATDEQVLAVIRDGGARHGLSSLMPANSDLSEEELLELALCVRSLR